MVLAVLIILSDLMDNIPAVVLVPAVRMVSGSLDDASRAAIRTFTRR